MSLDAKNPRSPEPRNYKGPGPIFKKVGYGAGYTAWGRRAYESFHTSPAVFTITFRLPGAVYTAAGKNRVGVKRA